MIAAVTDIGQQVVALQCDGPMVLNGRLQFQIGVELMDDDLREQHMVTGTRGCGKTIWIGRL